VIIHRVVGFLKIAAPERNFSISKSGSGFRNSPASINARLFPIELLALSLLFYVALHIWYVGPNFRVGFSAGPGKTCCRNKRQQEEPPVGLEAGSQLKSQGKWLGVGGLSVGLYLPLLKF